MAPILAALASWFWYDKRQRDIRMTKIEDRVLAQELQTLTQGNDDKVLAERIENLSNLLETKMGYIEASLNRLEHK